MPTPLIYFDLDPEKTVIYRANIGFAEQHGQTEHKGLVRGN
jgi:hypothetical protein